MSNSSIVFLMYHELELPGRAICQAEPGYARYVLGDSEFRDQIQWLKTNGWAGLSVSQALQYPEQRSVTITFDDGCETDLLAAAPTLREAGFNATFFITSGRLGTGGYLSHTQLKELSGMGFEIGCHSMTHSYLTDLDEQGLAREIAQPKTELEQTIGKAVEHFSCPGGRYDSRVLRVARSAGYRSVSTSRIHANSPSTDPFALGRVAMLRGVPLSAFVAICEGKSLRAMRAQAVLRDGAKKIMGNFIYDQLRSKVLRG
jgi:peptidoglycan/xylan/chitin deacetylase (PgdA/CDA1 family)